MNINIKAASLTALVCVLLVGGSFWRGLSVTKTIDLAAIKVDDLGYAGNEKTWYSLGDAFEKEAERAQRFNPNGAGIAIQRKLWCMGWQSRKERNIAYPPSCELLAKQQMPEGVSHTEMSADYKSWMVARGRWNPPAVKEVSILTREAACLGWEQKKRMNIEYYRFCEAPLKSGESMNDIVPNAWLAKEENDAQQRYNAANPWRAKQDAENAARLDATYEEGVVIREMRRMGYIKGLQREDLLLWLNSAVASSYVPSFKEGCAKQPIDKRSDADKAVCDVIERL
jgi:hypothetical protein